MSTHVNTSNRPMPHKHDSWYLMSDALGRWGKFRCSHAHIGNFRTISLISLFWMALGCVASILRFTHSPLVHFKVYTNAGLVKASTSRNFEPTAIVSLSIGVKPSGGWRDFAYKTCLSVPSIFILNHHILSTFSIQLLFWHTYI